MIKHRLRSNTSALSVMYDAILFIVMVSLSGILLLPAVYSSISVDTMIHHHREQIADEVLSTFLVTREDEFTYRACGEPLDLIATGIGINISSPGLYHMLTQYYLGREQRHKTYATLLAENLGCQLRLPISILGTDRLNFFTQDFSSCCIEQIDHFFSSYLSEKYHYNFTVYWYPIKALACGGELSVGQQIPAHDTYVATATISMPFTPIVTIGNHSFVLTKHWVQHHLLQKHIGGNSSSVPAVANISIILENYSQNTSSPFYNKDYAMNATTENVSSIVYGFLLYGITNETNYVLFPGIVSWTMTTCFEKLTQALHGSTTNLWGTCFGQSTQMMNMLFSSLNNNTKDPIFNGFLYFINDTIAQYINCSFPSISEGLSLLEQQIKNIAALYIHMFFDPLIHIFVEQLFSIVDMVVDFSHLFVDWLFDQLSLTTAHVKLTIWEQHI